MFLRPLFSPLDQEIRQLKIRIGLLYTNGPIHICFLHLVQREGGCSGFLEYRMTVHSV